MADSTCAAAGVSNPHQLELDHDPPLTQGERAAWLAWGEGRRDAALRCILPRCTERRPHPAFICPSRVGLLCKADHSRKTQREQQEGLA